MPRTVVAALVAALALGWAGCGSGERTETVSSTQLVQRLKVTCTAGERAGRRQLRGRGPLALFTARRDKRLIRVRLDALGRVAAADRSDQQRVLRAQIPAIDAAGWRAHRLVLAISEQLRLTCF
jgi:hypothetical protein